MHFQHFLRLNILLRRNQPQRFISKKSRRILHRPVSNSPFVFIKYLFPGLSLFSPLLHANCLFHRMTNCPGLLLLGAVFSDRHKHATHYRFSLLRNRGERNHRNKWGLSLLYVISLVRREPEIITIILRDVRRAGRPVKTVGMKVWEDRERDKLKTDFSSLTVVAGADWCLEYP